MTLRGSTRGPVLDEIEHQEEVERLIGAVRSPKHRAILMTSYAAGLRVGEVATLRISGVDAERMM